LSIDRRYILQLFEEIVFSLITSCQNLIREPKFSAGANPFEYLTQFQHHSSEVFKHPAQWIPWNYKDAFKELIPARASNSESASNPE